MTVAAPEHPHHQNQNQVQVHHPHPHHIQQHHSMPCDPSREHDRDVHGLRLALGSILSPKRLSTPSSHASSGTASPCPAHFGPGLVHAHAYHPGPSHLHTPVETQDHSDGLGHAVVNQEGPGAGVEGQGQLAVPQRPSSSLNRANSASNAFVPDYSQDQSHSHPHDRDHEVAPPILTTSNVHALSPSQAQTVKDVQGDSEPAILKRAAKENRERDGKENANARGVGAYIATLQSKRAWDALVHGNMS